MPRNPPSEASWPTTSRVAASTWRSSGPGGNFRSTLRSQTKGGSVERPDSLADDQLAAWKWLTKCYRELGLDGSAIVCDVLIHARTAKQIAESRGKTGPTWNRYYQWRLQECLRTLAEVYGFMNDRAAVTEGDERDRPSCSTAGYNPPIAPRSGLQTCSSAASRWAAQRSPALGIQPQPVAKARQDRACWFRILIQGEGTATLSNPVP